MNVITKRRPLLPFSEQHLLGLNPKTMLPVGQKHAMSALLYRSMGLLSPIAGGASGVHTRADVVTALADGTDLNDLWETYQAMLAVQNARRDGLVNFLSYPVTSPFDAVGQGGESKFERASEFGIPRAQRVELEYFFMGFAFDWFDSRHAWTWQAIMEMDQRQADALNDSMIAADNKLVFQHVMHALFRNTNRTVDIRKQAYTVYALYNNDGTVPPPYGPTVFLSTHQHYMTSGATLLDPGDVKAVMANVTEHGYTVQNGYQNILMVNAQEYDQLKMWKRGSTYNGVIAEYDFVPSVGSAPIIVPNADGLVGTQVPNTFNGLRVSGSYGDMLIISDDYIPPFYMVAFATGGPDSLNNPVGIREHANPAFRGLRLIPGDKQAYPLVDSYYQRGIGTGIRQRGAAAVMQLTAGAYAIPTQYATAEG
jgi:hypothetical protein